MKSALFITRAQPLHKGHLKVIKWILEKYDKVFIIVGSSQESHTEENPFTFEERKEMIERTLKSNGIEKDKYEIIGIPDIKDDREWTKLILEKAFFDVVFTLNPWTERCFKNFKIQVKKHPFFKGISASEIRKRIKEGKRWENLVPKEVEKILKKIDLKKRLHPMIR